MNVVLTYNEISNFIMKEFKIRPKFTSVDEKTFEVSYSPGMFMPNIICMTYDCAAPASLLIAGVVSYLEEKMPSGIEVNTTGKRVNIFPQRFHQIEKALEYVALSDITFEESSAKITLNFV